MHITFVEMKRVKINAQFLVALISISLAGIIGLQSYLFRSAIIVRQAQFTEQAAQALELVGKRLEAMEAQRFLSAQVNGPNIIYDAGSAIFGDSVLIFDPDMNSQSLIDSSVWEQRSYIQHQFEVTLDTNGLGKDFDRQIVIRAAAAQEKYKRFVATKLKRIDTLFRQMLVQGMGNFVPFEGRFTKQEIDSVLQSELSQKGLNINYEFAIYEDGFISPIKTDEFQAEQADFKVPLYKNDFFSGPKWLLISFPDRINYLLKSMWLMLALSGLFTTFIIVAFGYTINQMQKQKKISQIKSDFINNMTHEFKTPIATINLAVDALSNPKVKLDQNRIDHYRKIIREENNRMHGQVEKVLQLALLDKQELEIRKNEIDINELIEHSISHIYLQLEAKGAVVKTDLDAKRHVVSGDEIHLGNVMVNMIDNALKYAKEAPQIFIKTKEVEDRIVITIQDNGMGMTKDVQRKVFDRFYRQAGGNIHDVKGHGLGLSYVKEIIEMHNGAINVDSTLNVGTTFTIELPLIPEKNEL